jgi:hypothetical protein
MRWFEKPEILSYIIESYAGCDETRTNRPKRQFIWEDADGNIVLGNGRAFGDHLTEKFGLSADDGATRWIAVHQALRELGEVVGSTELRGPRQHVHKGKNQEPEIRILRKKERA